MIKTLKKKELDAFWECLGMLESKSNKSHSDLKQIKILQHNLELNARRVIWNKRGIKVIPGGKAKAGKAA